MENLSALEKLDMQIALLELNQKSDLINIRNRLTLGNLVKSKLSSLFPGENNKENTVDAILSISAGMIAKRLVMGTSNNIGKQIIGKILEVAVTGIALKNASKVKAGGSYLLSLLFKK